MSRKNTDARWQSNNKCFSSHINGHFWLSLVSSPNTVEVLFLRKAKRSFAFFRGVREWFCVGNLSELCADISRSWRNRRAREEGFFEVLARSQCGKELVVYSAAS